MSAYGAGQIFGMLVLVLMMVGVVRDNLARFVRGVVPLGERGDWLDFLGGMP